MNLILLSSKATAGHLSRLRLPVLALLFILTMSFTATAQNVTGFGYTSLTSVNGGTWTYGSVSNPFTVTYSGDVWDTKATVSYAPVATPTTLSGYLQPSTMLELGAFVNGSPSTALFTFNSPLPAGTVMFIQDVDALESFTIEFLDASGSVLAPSLIGAYNLSNPARSTVTFNATNLTVTAITESPVVNYSESLSDFVISSSLVKQVRITQIAGRDNLSASGTAEFYFAAPPLYTITGTVFDDANGNTILEAGEAITSGGTTLYVHLVNAAGIIVDVDAFEPGDLLYTLDAGQNLTYTIELSTIQYAVGTNTNSTPIVNTIPTGWVRTGENGTGTADGNANGELAVTTGTTNVTQQNFGIELPPAAPNQNYVIASPQLNAYITLNGDGTVNSPGPLTGSDEEDGTLGAGNTFTITSLAGMNGNTLWYNGVAITGPITITNYNPALLQVQLTGVGSSQLSFNYTVTDAAGVQDATTGTYTISWIAAAPLPVKLTGFSARLKDCNSMLSWVTASEENFSHFEIQQSTNAVSFKTIGKVDSKNIATGSSYQFTAANETAGINYYRLLMIDINGAKEYSQIIQVNGCISSSMRAYPNPARDHIQVEFKGTDATGKYELTDLVGRILQRGVLQANTTNTITIRGAATGTYVLKVWVDGELQTKQIQIFQ